MTNQDIHNNTRKQSFDQAAAEVLKHYTSDVITRLMFIR